MHTERPAREQHHRVAVLALLAAIALPAVATAQQGWSDQRLDEVLFPQDGTAAAALARLHSDLSNHVSAIDRACRLTEAQKNKLRLAGRGDIRRFFDRCEAAKEKLRLARDDDPKGQVVLGLPRNFVVVDQQNRAIVLDEKGAEVFVRNVVPLQRIMQAGLFQSDSLLYKSLRRTLTDEQLARFEALEAERRASRHRATIEQALAQIARGEPPLREAQRRDLIKLLAEEIKPPPKAAPPPYDLYYTLYMMGRLPERRLKPLFGELWPVAMRQVNQIRRWEGELRERGLLADEDGNAQAGPAPPAPKR